ncbi:putative functions as component of the transcription regulatory histone acetylation (HAT) complexes SAGA, SALSA and ADA [Lyophyllum shimeji]|uniref:Functions as component of the transcription regulatory histone acetylation (HAT) complexes SAGA, SALSA and ADA n=1 Tax=Lyophyllum shimeji TaxID=47721 RepID=A0A9P3PLX2_LYOSH|nr:putative functions as component of the transcription regulatory histone acetylation (HAT) complexes SAGA, SALSA and ADA [Lyophyllum shimeji]
MTVTQRKPQHLPDEIQTVNEPGVQYQCDSCGCDLTHTIRIKCADPACQSDDGVDICPPCFCAGKEFGKHQRWHAYRVIEINSYPIFTEDWGADEELLLVTGIQTHGLGNWKKIAEHVGTRTKEEVEKHYNEVYIDSPDWPLPPMDREFDIDPEEFQERKRRRISTMNAMAPPPPKVAPTSAPGIHEIATFLPGRLEFEHELDNDAEDLVKDLEFGIVLDYGGDEIPEDEDDLDVRARAKWKEELRQAAQKSALGRKTIPPGKGLSKVPVLVNGKTNGYHGNGDIVKQEAIAKPGDIVMANGTAGAGSQDDEVVEEPTLPPPFETPESLKFKLTLMEMYAQRVEKRLEGKALIFNRGLLEYKKMQAAEKKRPREERDIVNRLRPFAKLQTAEDYEAFASDMLYEAILRKKILDLQTYRRLGLTTAADIEKYEADLAKRAQAKANPARDYADRLHARAVGRHSTGPDPRRATSTLGDANEREMTPRLPGTAAVPVAPPVRRPPAPLNLANSPSLHLLTPAEQTLCSQLRILPKPYLVIKETLVREYARRGGKLRRREARDLVKIDVNKTSRIWDFLVQAGFLKITNEPTAASSAAEARTSVGPSTGTHSLNGSPMKDPQPRISPLPPPPIANASSSGSHNGSLYNASLSSTPSTAAPWPSH